MSAPAQPIPTHDTPILVIDDDRFICTMLVEVLKMAGYVAKAALIPYDQPAVAAAAALHALQRAVRPTIILADPMTFGIPNTEALCDYLQDETQRRPHLLYLITALIAADAARAMSRLHGDGLIAMPVDIDALLALIAGGERILRDRTSTPPDPFTLDF